MNVYTFTTTAVTFGKIEIVLTTANEEKPMDLTTACTNDPEWVRLSDIEREVNQRRSTYGQQYTNLDKTSMAKWAFADAEYKEAQAARLLREAQLRRNLLK